MKSNVEQYKIVIKNKGDFQLFTGRSRLPTSLREIVFFSYQEARNYLKRWLRKNGEYNSQLDTHRTPRLSLNGMGIQRTTF